MSETVNTHLIGILLSFKHVNPKNQTILTEKQIHSYSASTWPVPTSPVTCSILGVRATSFWVGFHVPRCPCHSFPTGRVNHKAGVTVLSAVAVICQPVGADRQASRPLLWRQQFVPACLLQRFRVFTDVWQVPTQYLVSAFSSETDFIMGMVCAN